MPITTTVEVINTISSLTFNANGTMDATFNVAINGEAMLDKHFHIDVATTTAILDAAVPDGFTTMREGIVAGVYIHLLTTGQLVGTVS